ncbi:MAG: tyrosine-type recombinase/integrase [Candidatus Bathyarchaeia archaeon]
MTHVRGLLDRTQRKTVISEEEFSELLAKAEAIPNVFFKLRAKALLCILRLTGKRRSELARLELSDFEVEEGMLHIRFTLLKKRKKTVLTKQSIKSVSLTEPLAKSILEYLSYLNGLQPKPQYFFPSVRSVFGNIVIIPNEHLSDRQLFNIVRSLSPKIWMHLFRETVAADIIKQDSTIIGAFKVQRRLDLESYQTGFNYLRRFALDIIERETKKT